MQRFFGSKKPEKEAPSLADASKGLDSRSSHIDSQIAKCDEELIAVKKLLASSKTPASQNMHKQKALQILKRKKMYEQQREQLFGTQMTIDQCQFMAEQTKTTLMTVDALKASTTAMKKEMKLVNFNDLERLMDDMEDLKFDQEEIQEIMSRSYDLSGVNDMDIDAEFAALQEEISAEQVGSALDNQYGGLIPSYLPGESQKQATTTDPNAVGI